MTARLGWMRGRTGVARHAERAAPFRTAQMRRIRTQPAGTR
jgi:hypothetical protein